MADHVVSMPAMISRPMVPTMCSSGSGSPSISSVHQVADEVVAEAFGAGAAAMAPRR